MGNDVMGKFFGGVFTLLGVQVVACIIIMFAIAEVTMFDKYIIRDRIHGFYGPNQEYGTRLMLSQRGWRKMMFSWMDHSTTITHHIEVQGNCQLNGMITWDQIKDIVIEDHGKETNKTTIQNH